MCVSAWLACMSVYHRMRAEACRGQKRGQTDGSEPARGCWDSNPGPLEEQLVLLTTELSLQPPRSVFPLSACKVIKIPLNLLQQHSRNVVHCICIITSAQVFSNFALEFPRSFRSRWFRFCIAGYWHVRAHTACAPQGSWPTLCLSGGMVAYPSRKHSDSEGGRCDVYIS